MKSLQAHRIQIVRLEPDGAPMVSGDGNLVVTNDFSTVTNDFSTLTQEWPELQEFFAKHPPDPEPEE